MGRSSPVRSNQDGPHPRLEEVVRRHAAAPWRQPVHGASEAVFERVDALRLGLGAGRPVVLDSGCGTGVSTRRLERRHPEAVVVGVDRSAARLARGGAGQGPAAEGNVIWCRAELSTFWRLALDREWPVTGHYLLYPNPWPKAAHLQRRWHGHPVFPALLALGGRLELRSNWRLYVEEFATALGLLSGRRVAPEPYRVTGEPLSPFEEKYAASGHDLWRLILELPNPSK